MADPTVRRGRTLGVLAAVALGVGLLSGPRGAGQPAHPFAPAGRGGEPATIEPTAPILNLFQRAEDAVTRRDWKLAIDSLQRIVEDPQGSLVARAFDADGRGRVYESARRAALRRMAAMPEEGLEAYHLLYDGKASGLLREARERHEEAALREIVERYPLTLAAPEAADLLASWALDEGRPVEALWALGPMRGLMRRSDVVRRTAALKLAAAYAWLGRPAEGIEQAKQMIAGSVDADGALAQAETVAEALSSPALRQLPERDPAATASWPMVGGAPGRQGCMAGLDPALSRPTPWRYALADSGAEAWRPVVTTDPQEPLAAPPIRLVADSSRILVRTPARLVALDMGSLRPVWEAAYPARREREMTTARQFRSRLRFGQLEEASLADGGVDARAWAVAAGHGLVYALCQMVPPEDLRMMLTARGMGVPWDATPTDAACSVLAAFDAARGDLLWELGHPGDPAPFDGAQIRGAPLAVGPHLWVPVQRQRDLYVAVVHPSDGAVIENILLTTLPSRVFPLWHLLAPAAGDGMVFIPSGFGVLFAVSAEDRSIQWAYRYAPSTADGVPADWAAASERLSSTVVASDGLVLLAPVDGQTLFAVSAVDGEPVWSVPIEASAYLVGAAPGRIWLGGRRLECLSSATGTMLWTAELTAAPTGRAVLAGDRIFIPTWEGLARFDAQSGQPVGPVPMPGDKEPLGDLLCLQDAMFSADPAAIRRFPDVERAMPAALARHADDPADTAAAVHVAWLELLRGEPHRAYEVFTRGSFSPQSVDPAAAEAVAHVQVEALLAMADQAGKRQNVEARQEARGSRQEQAHSTPVVAEGVPRTPPASSIAEDEAGMNDSPLRSRNEAVALLHEALGVAVDPQDRLRCALALAGKLTEAGHLAEAYRSLLAVGMAPEGERVTLLEDDVEAPSRFYIARRLQALGGDMSEDEQRRALGAFEQTVAAAIEQSYRDGTESVLRAAVDLGIDDARGSSRALPLTLRATMALVDQCLAEQRFEQAEQLVLDARRRFTADAAAVVPLMTLLELYAEAWSLGGKVTHPILAELGSRFGNVPMPGDATRTVGQWTEDAIDRGKHGGQTPERANGAGAASRGSGPHGRAVGPHGGPYDTGPQGGPYDASNPNRTRYALTGEYVWAPIVPTSPTSSPFTGFSDQRVLPPVLAELPVETAGLLEDRILALTVDGPIECYAAANGESIWRATLEPPERFEPRRSGFWREARPAVSTRAAASGHTAIFSTAEGLYAVGLVSGKRVWFRPTSASGGRRYRAEEAGGFFDANTASKRPVPVAGGEGWYAAAFSHGRLTAGRMEDGRTIWERDLRGEPIDSIQVFRLDEAAETSNRGERGESNEAGGTRKEAQDRAGRRPASPGHDPQRASDSSAPSALGSAPLRSRLRGASGVRSDERIVVSDAKWQRVHIVGADDGRLIRRVLFRQPDPAVERVRLVATRGVLAGPVSERHGDSILAVRLADGETAWESSLPKPLVQLFEPAAGYIAVAMLGGRVRLYQAADGEIVFDRQISGAHRVFDGLLVDATLVVRQADGQEAGASLTGVDLATGDTVWERGDLAPLALDPRPLRLFHGLLPAILRDDVQVTGRRKHLGLTMLDPRTGEQVGGLVEFVHAYADVGVPVSVALRPGVAVLSALDGLFAFEMEAVENVETSKRRKVETR